MATSINSSPPPPGQDLLGQTVLLIGGSSGIGLEAARLARAQGADIILTARNPDRLYRAGLELGASIAAFDATDFGRLGRFFDALPAPIDHLLITGPGPYHPRLAEFDLDAARRDIDAHLLLPLRVATNVAGNVRPGGTLLFLGGACSRRAATGIAFTAALTAALSAMTRDLALEVAPVRVNLIVAGHAGTLPGGTLPGGTRPAGRVVDPASIAALAVHLMTDTAVTGATFDIDSRQRAVER
jgi:NAD(P)-dependent dehydrogenase (short-subunit alcohol dehydrogenase family)